MADNQNQAANNAPNVADQIAAMMQMQQQFEQRQADALIQAQQQQADAMLQMQQQIQANFAQQLAALNLAPPAPGPTIVNANVAADGNPVVNAPAQRKPFKVTGRAPQFCIEQDKENFLIWKEDWSCFLFSSGINQLDDEEERNQYAYAHLSSALSMSTKKWLDSIEMSDVESQDADHLVEVLETQVLETTNPTQAMVLRRNNMLMNPSMISACTSIRNAATASMEFMTGKTT